MLAAVHGANGVAKDQGLRCWPGFVVHGRQREPVSPATEVYCCCLVLSLMPLCTAGQPGPKGKAAQPLSQGEYSEEHSLMNIMLDRHGITNLTLVS